MSVELPSAPPDPGPGPTARPAVAGVSAAGYTLLGLDEASGDGTPFGERKGRFSGAFGTSVAAHILFILLFWGLTLLPEPVASLAPEQPVDTSQLIWANVPGPGGGGGGGGNQMQEPPKKMETKPADKLAVPVAKPVPQVPKELPKETPPQIAELNIPVRPMDAGQLPQTGMLDAPSAPTPSQGSGTGGGAGTGRGRAAAPVAASTRSATASARRRSCSRRGRSTPPKRCARRSRASRS